MMNTAAKALISVCLLAIAVAIAAMKPIDARGSETAVSRPKDQSRLPSTATHGEMADYADNLLQLAHAVKPRPAASADQGEWAVADAGGPLAPLPPGFAPPAGGPRHGLGQGLGQGPGPGPGQGPGWGPGPALARPPGLPAFAPMPPDRHACAEQIDHGAGAAGYLKSKLNLDGAQKDAWLKIEQAAEPVVQKMRQFCASLPAEPGAPPNFPTLIEMADTQFTLRAEFVRAIVAPAKALYELLSPEQRAVLDRPLPPAL